MNNSSKNVTSNLVLEYPVTRLHEYVLFDFSGKRVRRNGKVMDKFSIAFAIDSIKPFAHATLLMDVMSYSEMSDWLRKILYNKVL